MNCGSTTYEPGNAVIFKSYTLNKDISTGTDLGTKEGKACASNILGWFSSGEAGVKEAAVKGDIKKVKAVDYSVLTVLGVYAKLCTIARGD